MLGVIRNTIAKKTKQNKTKQKQQQQQNGINALFGLKAHLVDWEQNLGLLFALHNKVGHRKNNDD